MQCKIAVEMLLLENQEPIKHFVDDCWVILKGYSTIFSLAKRRTAVRVKTDTLYNVSEIVMSSGLFQLGLGDCDI